MDVDIDFPTTFDPIEIFIDATRASMVKDGKLIKHPAGVYFQPIPVDGVTGLAAIPYKQAEELGFTKIDFLHLAVLDVFANKQQIRGLLKREPDWFLLLDSTVVPKLFQLHKHHDLLLQVRPTNVQELADCIALIRPGKHILIDEYCANKAATRPKLYAGSDQVKFTFKKSHSIAYALTIVLQLHLIKAGIL